MLHWKRMLVPTKLTKIVCFVTVAVSVTVISLRFMSKDIKNPQVMYTDTNVKERRFAVNPEIRYILHWKNPASVSIENGDGSLLFQARKCKFDNCYLTDRSKMLPDFSTFLIILFDSPDIKYFENTLKLPKNRAQFQKYVFVSGDSAAAFPACRSMWNNYFNWAWTYKLDSDLIWRYFIIKDDEGKIVGPKRNMHWLNIHNMKPVDSKFIMKLRSKNKIAAWFASTCKTESHREEFVEEVQNYLSQYKLEVDIYGNCGFHVCSKSKMNMCEDMLAKEYFFYFAFENAMSEDYVTDIVLHALNHDIVPVVFGGANYTRFLPDGSYLNALQYGPERLVRRMIEIMHNPSVYQMFFRWKNHYSYHAHDESPETDNYCKLCAILNDDDKFYKDNKVKENFTSWWNPKHKCKTQ